MIPPVLMLESQVAELQAQFEKDNGELESKIKELLSKQAEMNPGICYSKYAILVERFGSWHHPIMQQYFEIP